MESIASGSSTAPSAKKRKAQKESLELSENSSKILPKKHRKGKGKAEQQNHVWPEYFNDLFKVFKALNTVLAFCTSRKHLAITFPVVRSSVESLLRRPLELSKVAELKAILPDLIKFAYIPRNQLRINEESQTKSSASSSHLTNRATSPNYEAFARAASSSAGSAPLPNVEDDEHVLVLDFVAMKGSGAGKKADNPANTYQMPPALSPTEVRKLIEKRNERFKNAVNELLEVATSEDPVELVQAAARDHIPVDPKAIAANAGSLPKIPKSVPKSEERPTISDVLDDIVQAEWYRNQIVHRETFEAREGQEGQLRYALSETIKQALLSFRKITNLYTHQADAIDAIQEGEHVIVSTSTASGKSVIYQVPMLRFLEDDSDAKGIYIYPTKALAQDQRAALEQLLWSCRGLEDVKVATYDGDTPKEFRLGIRETASVIFTNFDMLHASILPNEDCWRDFLKNLKLVAVDELHYYSGVFASHVALIMRRLRRVCAAVGNRRVRFVSCSATIANPQRHMRDIFGVDITRVITNDGAPSGSKDFLVWNPPPIDEMDPSLGRQSPMFEATRLMRELMSKGIRTILFCKIRKSCEQAMKMLRNDLSAAGRHDILERVMAYRGGYSQQDRRRIEQQAFSGSLLGIVATNALELGVDIGSLDAVIMLGFPFGIASFRQQSGRAGRRAHSSLSVLVADSFALDQYYVQHPQELFSKNVDELNVDWQNRVILEAHLQCASNEIPLRDEDEVYFGAGMKDVCSSRLIKDKEGWYHTNPKHLPFPSQHVSIRGAREETYTVIDITQAGAPKLLEEIEHSRALFETYEGAVFLHQGQPYIVQEVSHDTRMAKIIRTDVNWTTSPRDFTDVDAVQTSRIREIKGSPVRAFYGQVDLKTTIFGYFKIRAGVILDAVDLEMPPFERSTSGFWIDVPRRILDIFHLKALNAAEAIHSAEHAFLNQFSLAADVRTECKVAKKEYMIKDSNRKRPARLIFYDSAGTEGAIAAKAFDHVSNILSDAFEAVESCPCKEGCAKCIVSPYCKENNTVSSKLGAQIIIRGVLGLPINVDAIPDPELKYNGIQLPETIVEAEPVRTVEGVEVELYAD